MAKNYLEGLMGENERVLLETHQHWFVLFNKIFLEIILIVLIIAVSSFVYTYYPIAIAGLALVIVPVAGMLKDIMVWRNNAYLVTNRRVIQISGVLGKDVVDSSLEKVNDVKMSQSFFGRLFGYGDVEILTASELGVNKFARLDRPIHFKTAMLNAKESLDSGGGSRPHRAAGDLPGLLAALDELRRSGVLSEDEFQSKKSELLKRM